MHSASRWTYAPRPSAWPARSMAAPPSGVRTSRVSSPFRPSRRQATQVLAGSCPRLGICWGLAWLDVDAESRELGGQPRVLPIASDGEGELLSGHEDRR